MKKVKILLVCAFCILGIICVAGIPVCVSAEKVVKFGITGPFSGPAANWGIEPKKTYELFFDEVNASGGLNIGGEKYKIQVIAYDHKYSAPEAVSAVTRLIQHDGCKHITVMLGAMVYATAPIMHKAGVLSWAMGFGKETLSPNYPRQVSSMLFPPELTCAWKLIRKYRPDLKTVAGVYYKNESGKWSEELSKINGPANGYKFLETELVEVGTVDFSPALLKVLKNKPDILEISGLNPGDTGSIIKTARGMGFRGPIAHLGTPDVVTTMKIAGAENCEDFIVAGCVSEELPTELKGYASVRDKYLAKYGPPFNSVAWQFCHLPAGVIHALQKAGSVDPEKVIRAVETLKFPSPLGGEASYGGKEYYGVNRQIQYQPPLSIVKSGKLEFMGLIPIEYIKK
jgi:branched-chain amino acid transport system substrate-binding protein